MRKGVAVPQWELLSNLLIYQKEIEIRVVFIKYEISWFSGDNS